MTRPTLLLLLAIAVTLYVLASAPQTAPDASAPSLETRTREAYARLALHAFSRSAPEEAAFLDRTDGGDPSPPSAPGLFMALDQEAGDTKADGAGATDSPVSGLASSADLDLADWALPTLPPLRPLASDCRLPCYGTPRVGPASWYYDGPGWYAAIPGYLGGVVSVVVCTFPDGQANCHTFPVIDSCQCYRHEKRERVVDLSPAAYRLFAPLSTGIVMVTVTVLR